MKNLIEKSAPILMIVLIVFIAMASQSCSSTKNGVHKGCNKGTYKLQNRR